MSRAAHGTCRMCRRRRKEEHLKDVAEVRHGFALGHIWECRDEVECDHVAARKLADPAITETTRNKISDARAEGRYTRYRHFS